MLTAMVLIDFLKKKFFSTVDILLKNDEEEYEVELIDKKILNDDTRIFKFGFSNQNQILGLPIGQHIRLITKINDENISRPYTPISTTDVAGYFELIIKVYFKNVNPNFPKGGKMTQYLETLKLGDKMKIKGPKGKIIYKGGGEFQISKKDEKITHKFSNIGLIAGGSGIAPIYQLMQAITLDEKDSTKVHLLFANHTEKDILLRNEIEEMARKYPKKIKFWYTITNSDPEWKYSTGFITKEMIEKHIPPPDNTTGIFMCGPPPMIKFALLPNLKELGYDENTYFKY